MRRQRKTAQDKQVSRDLQIQRGRDRNNSFGISKSRQSINSLNPSLSNSSEGSVDEGSHARSHPETLTASSSGESTGEGTSLGSSRDSVSSSITKTKTPQDLAIMCAKSVSDLGSAEDRLRCLDEENVDEEESDTEDNYFREAPNFDEIGSYDDYLDHYVTWKDLFYFESEETARVITTLGFRVPELLGRVEFETLMGEIRAKRLEKRKDDVNIAYEVAEYINCPLMQELAEREVLNRTGNLSCIIFIRTMNSKKQEVSAWIDFRSRLQLDDTLWYDYYTGRKKLIPRPSDLCYYNWSNFQVRFNSTENYLVTTDIADGLQFMNKDDRKLITVNPKVPPGDNTECLTIIAPNYYQCILYNHFLRIKA